MTNVTFSIHKTIGDEFVNSYTRQVPDTESLVVPFKTFKELFVDDEGWFNAGFSVVRVDEEYTRGSRCVDSCLIFRTTLYAYIAKLAADAAEGKVKLVNISAPRAIAIYSKVIAMIDLMEASDDPHYVLDIR